MTKILSVDDEQDLELLLTQYFRRQIRKGDYEFLFAHNGIEALEVMAKHPDIDIVLSDINMPEMDGLTLLARINEMQNPAIRVIMVSAYGDMGNIRQAMNNGAFDFATKPIDLDDLAVTIEKAVTQINYVKNSEKEHTQLESLKGDIAIAAGIQQAILPKISVLNKYDSIDVAAVMRPAKDVGGDFYDFFPLDDDRIGLVMADVSGKGIPAAIFMAVSRTLLRTIAMQGYSSAEALTRANGMLCNESVNEMFVTVFYAIYNVRTGDIDYCNGGHNAPFIMRANGNVEQLPTSKNCLVGIVDNWQFSGNTEHLNLGDTLVMYTDGVNEAFNVNDEEYGEDRMAATLSTLNGNNSQIIVDGLLADVRSFATGAEQSDDITILAIKNGK